MKDSYSLDLDEAGLDDAFDLHHGAYKRIFGRFGVEAVDVQASSGAMGGSGSIEFMVRSPAGEDWIVTCDRCDYRSNQEKATSHLADPGDPVESGDPVRFATPGLRTIKSLAEAFPDTAMADRQIKTLVYVIDGRPALVLLRGDHDLLEQKLLDATGGANIRPADGEQIVELLGAQPGSLGAVGVDGVRIVADHALAGRRGMVTGANEDDWHLQSGPSNSGRASRSATSSSSEPSIRW
jgi:prolyl-tRNA synthetase